jgi:hypothetical protein
MSNWHGYFAVERQNIGAGNWAALQVLFESMGDHGSVVPVYNTHKRTRLDGDAVIYESRFDSSEVSIAAFKQLLAGEFGIDVADIEIVTGGTDYAGIGTAVWQFNYPAGGLGRFKVERFGGGAAWDGSRLETLGYLAANIAQWDTEA